MRTGWRMPIVRFTRGRYFTANIYTENILKAQQKPSGLTDTTPGEVETYLNLVFKQTAI